MNTIATEKKPTITETNSLIAEFLGFKKELFYLNSPDADKNTWNERDFGFYDLPFSGGIPLASRDKTWFQQTELKFHSDWNWLMPVVEKCYTNKDNDKMNELTEKFDFWKIDLMYNAVVEYIKWYNNEKNKV